MKQQQQQTHEEMRKCFAEQTGIMAQHHHILYERINDVDSRVSKGAGKGARQLWQASVNDSRAAESSSMQATANFVSRCGGVPISEAPAFQLEGSKRQRVEQQKVEIVHTRKQADAARKIAQDAESTFFAWLAASKCKSAKPEEVKALEDAANEAMRRELALEQYTPVTPTEVVCTSDVEAVAHTRSVEVQETPASPELVASSHVSVAAAEALVWQKCASVAV